MQHRAVTAKPLPPTELGPPALLWLRTPDPQGSDVLRTGGRPWMQGLGVAGGVYSGGLSLHPAVRVSDFQRRPG